MNSARPLGMEGLVAAVALPLSHPEEMVIPMTALAMGASAETIQAVMGPGNQAVPAVHLAAVAQGDRHQARRQGAAKTGRTEAMEVTALGHGFKRRMVAPLALEAAVVAITAVPGEAMAANTAAAVVVLSAVPEAMAATG